MPRKSQVRIAFGFAMASCVVAAGCGAPVSYHVKTNVPWPDQWVAGPRVPYSRQLSVAADTVTWHRNADVNRLAATVERKLAAKSSVFGFARTDYARRVSDPSRPDRDALPFVEVRVVPVWLLATANSQATSLDESAPLRAAVEKLARSMGRSVVWPDTSTLSAPCGPAPRADARLVLMRVLLSHNLFVRCEDGPPDVLRSLEFHDERAFIGAIEAAARQSAARNGDSPLEIMHLADWVVDYVNRVCGGAEAAPVTIPARTVGFVSSRDVTDEVLEDVRQQLLSTLEFHVR